MAHALLLPEGYKVVATKEKVMGGNAGMVGEGREERTMRKRKKLSEGCPYGINMGTCRGRATRVHTHRAGQKAH